jgi:DNA-directed RNA polymerase specialized sigma24 family protein
MEISNYTVPFVVALMQNKGKLIEASEHGSDMTATDMLMDLDYIMNRAELTDKQKLVVETCWVKGFSQREAGKLLGISQQMCTKHSNAVKKKIEITLKTLEEDSYV